MAEFEGGGQDVTLVKIGALCRICLSENDERSINVLKCDYAALQNVINYFGIQINGNEQKSTMLCSHCQDKVQCWLNDKKQAEHNQIVVDFLASRQSSNFIEKDQSVEHQTNNSMDYNITNISSESNNKIKTSKSTNLCPFCHNYDKSVKIDKKNFCKKHATPFTCLIPKCYSVFSSKSILIPHYRSHLNLASNSFLCNICLNVLDCSRNESKKKHIHQILPKLFTCCSKQFPTMTDFACHKLQEHDGDIITFRDLYKKKTSTNELKPNIISSQTNRRLRAVTPATTNNKDLNISKTPETFNSRLAGMYVCHNCPIQFSSLSTFVEHSKTIHGISYQLKENEIKLCPLCDENYVISNFVEHISMCTNSMKVGDDSLNEYGCIHCGIVYNGMTASQFRNHFNYCRSFDAEGAKSDKSDMKRKCKNCLFESFKLEDCIQHANSYCIDYKLKTKYAKESSEKIKVLERMELQKQTKIDIVMLFIKPEKTSDIERNLMINNSSSCDWSRQTFLGPYIYFCNVCKKGFFSVNVFLNHLTFKEKKCRSNKLIYCARCLTDFESIFDFNGHLPGPTDPPPTLSDLGESSGITTLNGHKPFVIYSKSIKVESDDFELSETMHYFHEEENNVMDTAMVNKNDLQLADDNKEIKTLDTNSTLFQLSEDSKSDMNGIILLKDSNELVYNNPSFQDSEDSNEADIGLVQIDEDKPSVNILNSSDCNKFF